MSTPDDFDEFMERYPLVVAPLAARRAYWQARHLATRLDLLEGVERYVAHLGRHRWLSPAHPTTWLNGGRWMDQYPGDAPDRRRRFDQYPCPHQTHCCSPYTCQHLQELAATKVSQNGRDHTEIKR